jgi:phosphoesterase RecJ-like protein
MNKILQQIYQQILKSHKILLVTHNNPDGDALSSVCTMIELLEYMNKDYLAYCYNQPSKTFSFLPHIEKITSNKKDLDFSSFDLIISLDCGSLSRTALVDEIKNKNNNQIYIEIDHHSKVDNYADIEARYPKASATTELLYYFFKTNKLIINETVANCILTGIVTDTGNFIYQSTSYNTILIASELLSFGAKLPRIVDKTWRNKSLISMKLWGLAMSRLQIDPKTNIAFTVLTINDFKQWNANEDDIDGVSGFIGNLPNVKAVMLLRQTSPDIIKGSLRTTRNDIDVSKLARTWGGGGHAKASGFTVKGNLKLVNKKWRIVD